EVHAEDGRHRRGLRTVGGLSVDLVDDGLNLHVVVRHHRRLAGRVVGDLRERERVRRSVAEGKGAREVDSVCRAAVLDERVYLRRIEVFDAEAGRTVDPVVRRVLVGPGRVATGSPDHFEDRVGLDELVGIDGIAISLAIFRVGQVRRVDGAEQLRVVELRGFEVRGFGARLALAVTPGRVEGSVVAV